MDRGRERWIDEDAGPLVRPYAMTRGRTRPRGEQLDVVAILVRTGRRTPERLRPSPEQRDLLTVCRTPHTVADLASELDLPLGVVDVLLAELLEHGLLEVAEPPTAARPDDRMLRRVLNDLRAL